MEKPTILKIISILFIIILSGCEKEEEINDPEPITVVNDINLKLGGALCAYDTSSNLFYFPVSSDTLQEYITLVNYSYDAKTVYLNEKKLVNNSYNDLGAIYTNSPYKLQIQYDEEVINEYGLIFITSPIIQIFTNTDIADEPKIMAKLLINNPFYYNDGELSREIESLAGIEIRGNIYLGRPKSSYSFELWSDESGEEKKDVSLLGLRQDDDWILDGMCGDLMRMRNRVSFDIWNSIFRLYYSHQEPEAMCGIRGKFVEVFLNNEYQGIYCLNEKIDRKQLKLKEFQNITRGLLYKGEEWGEGSTSFYSFKDTTADISWDGWEQQYPKPEEQILWAPLYNFVKFVVESEDNEFKDNIDQWLDIDNAVDYYVFLNLIMGTDNMGKNIFLARYDTNDVFFLIPWDMDWTYGRYWDTIAIGYTGMLTNNLFDRLLSTDSNNFKYKLKERWESLREDELTFENIIGHFEKYKDKFIKSGVIDRENKRWENADLNLEDEFTLVKEWINNRIIYLDNHFNDL